MIDLDVVFLGFLSVFMIGREQRRALLTVNLNKFAVAYSQVDKFTAV